MTFVRALYVVLKRVYMDSELVRSKFSQPITKISTNENQTERNDSSYGGSFRSLNPGVTSLLPISFHV